MIRRPDNQAWRRSGFTLMELMVSVAILLAVLSLIGTIFATTSKAGGNATSMSLMHRQLSQVAEMIKRDLEYTTPGSGGAPMAIAGKMIAAHETAKDRDLGVKPTPHRADILMLFTTAAQDTFVYKDPAPLSQLAQVVYGHADTAKFDPNTGMIDLANTLKRIDDDTIPIAQRPVASTWHLARRVIRSLAGNPPYAAPLGAYVGPTGNPVELTNSLFLTGEREVLWYAVAGVTSLFPDSGLLQYSGYPSFQLVGYPSDYPAPSAFGTYAYCYGKLFALSPGDGRWWMGSPWARSEWDFATSTLVPQALNAPTVPTNPSVYLANYDLLRRSVLYDYAAPVNQPRRSVVDPKPPLGVDNAMRWNFLPGCSEFKVEYTYDDPRELNLTTAGEIDLVPRPIHWYAVPDGGQIIWSGVSVNPKNTSTGDPAPTDPRRWPRAIRITLKAWDPSGRLTDPVTRTIVHTW